MKSLLVTAVVLSSFATQGHAEQPDPKSKDANAQPASREQSPPAGIRRPEVKAQPPQGPAPKAVTPSAPNRQSQSPTQSQAPVQPQTPAPRASMKTTPAAQIPAAPPAQAPGRPAPSIKATPTPTAAKTNQPAPLPPAGQRPGPQPTVLKAPGKPGAPGQVAHAQVPPAQTQAPRAQVPGNRPAPPVFAPIGGRGGPLVMQHGMVTPAHIQAVQLRNQAFVQQNPHLQRFVETRGQAYRAAYHQQLVTLQTRFLAPAYLAPLRVQYRPWVRVGFYAYAYPVRPVIEFYTYFSNPCVAWFYNDYDADFYQPYYGQYYQRYPDLNRGYNRVGMYLPTEEFLAMNVALSELQIEAQINYRRSMIYLGNRLSERYRAPIGRHQVIVNHYTMLPSNRAVIVEGFVDNEHNQMPFRALVDLNNADESQLFAVGSWSADQQPTVEQSEDLYDLNDQVVDYGGSIEEPPAS